MFRCLLGGALTLGLVLPAVGSSFRSHEVLENQPPPEPEGSESAVDADGSFATKAAACQACRYAATGSCAMYKTCVCYATNTFFPIGGVPNPTDKNDWHWACGDEAGSKYGLCFKVDYQQRIPLHWAAAHGHSE